MIFDIPAALAAHLGWVLGLDMPSQYKYYVNISLPIFFFYSLPLSSDNYILSLLKYNLPSFYFDIPICQAKGASYRIWPSLAQHSITQVMIYNLGYDL